MANEYDRGAERSSANIDTRHSLTTSFTWELPFGKGRLFGSNWAPPRMRSSAAGKSAESYRFGQHSHSKSPFRVILRTRRPPIAAIA